MSKYTRTVTLSVNCRRVITWSSVIWLSLGAAWADQITMKNGDRVTGSIIKKDGKTITIKTTEFGEVTTPWDHVESITADKPVTVVLENGQSVQGTLATTGGKIEVVAPNRRVDVAPGEITTIRNADEQRAYERLLKPGWLDLWAGTATIGLAGTSGNARTSTFTTSVAAARVTNTDKTALYFNAIKASAFANGLTSDTAQAIRGGVSYDRNLSPRLFLNLFNDYEYDRFQDLDLRFVIGAGLGFHVIKTERSTLDLLAGFDYNHSRFSTPEIRNSGEIYWGDDYKLKLTGATSLIQSFRMFNNLSETGEYRVNGDLGLTTKVWKWLTWNLSLSDRYLSRPAPGRKTNDFLYTTGLGVTFAR